MFDLTLTFDNGPHPGVTPEVLNCLAQHDIRTTFFVVGERFALPGMRRICEQAHAAGHWIGNHTWTHSVPLGEREGDGIADEEIGRTQDAIGALAQPSRYFRPFGGGGRLDRCLLSQRVVDYLRVQRYTCVLWNAIPRDWAEPEAWVDRALEQCEQQPWTLMVLHDLPTGAMRHLSRFLDLVEDRGGRFRQDFPPDCVPIRDGEIVRPIDRYVTA